MHVRRIFSIMHVRRVFRTGLFKDCPVYFVRLIGVAIAQMSWWVTAMVAVGSPAYKDGTVGVGVQHPKALTVPESQSVLKPTGSLTIVNQNETTEAILGEGHLEYL